MPWVKLDDHFDEHPKIAASGPLCLALFVTGLSYCNRNLTDGFIPRSVAFTLLEWTHPDNEGTPWQIGITPFKTEAMAGPGYDIDSTFVIDVLVDNGIWDEVRGGYRVHDYLDYQPSKSEVLAERSRAAERQKKAREKRESQRDNGESHGEVTDESRRESRQRHTGPVPVPNPVPKQSRKTKTSPAEQTSTEGPGAALPDLSTLRTETLDEMAARLNGHAAPRGSLESLLEVCDVRDANTEPVLRDLWERMSVDLVASCRQKALDVPAEKLRGSRTRYLIGTMQRIDRKRSAA